uniref:Uncharacterized protein n=1 Tax=viral metagenome TaxID=1070528 RepID=A0A6M3LRS3_9ZZZZ
MRKYTYYKVIQGNYGRGWDDVDFHECDSTGYMKPEDRAVFKENVKAYRENEPQPHRVIFRRELNV